MIFYLRNSNRIDYGEAEFFVRDERLVIEVHINIEEYSALLLTHKNKPFEVQRIVDAFVKLSALSGWLNETWFMGRKNTAEDYDKVVAQLRVQFGQMSKLTRLKVVED